MAKPESHFQSEGLREPHCMGIDEAGRGPVLGPMVYGACVCPLSKQEDLKKCKFDDSKKISERQRENFFEGIKESEYLGWIVTVLTARELSGKMLRRNKYNLNSISYDTAIDMIQHALDSGINVTEVYVDTVGDPVKYEARLHSIFPGISFVVKPKADALYPIVSAASICAKVTRDHVLMEEVGGTVEEIGSGYPGDPATKAWLQKNIDPIFGFPRCVRFSWGTAKELMKEKCISMEWSDDEDEYSRNPIGNFFGKDGNKDRYNWFKKQKLDVVSAI